MKTFCWSICAAIILTACGQSEPPPQNRIQGLLSPAANTTGLVTTATEAYRLNAGYANRPFVERIGTVPLNQKCGASGSGSGNASTIQVFVGNDGKEYRVISDRNKVTLNSGVSRPLIIYAICGTPTTQPPPPAGTINLPAVCPDASKEGLPIGDCAWSVQRFAMGSATALVRACAAETCTVDQARWRKLGSLTATQYVEVCGVAKSIGAPIANGECRGTTAEQWGAMKLVPPQQVAGYAKLPDEPNPPTGVSVTLRWTPPTQNTDGSALTDLAGYRIAYGTASGVFPNAVQVNNPSTTSYVLNLPSRGTYYFVVRAYTQSGAESSNSNQVSITK
ncbi:MAG TPA: fibronectin type III domain-containing protein [Gammaproteobacteria bacterium]|nr:fibronectin type III domain-containing protein [Gammaproteobacteria bacterium]